MGSGLRWGSAVGTLCLCDITGFYLLKIKDMLYVTKHSEAAQDENNNNDDHVD